MFTNYINIHLTILTSVTGSKLTEIEYFKSTSYNINNLLARKYCSNAFLPKFTSNDLVGHVSRVFDKNESNSMQIRYQFSAS